MNSILNKEPVLRAEKSLKQFNPGLKVIVFEGDKMNIKLTDESDLEIFEQIYDMKLDK